MRKTEREPGEQLKETAASNLALSRRYCSNVVIEVLRRVLWSEVKKPEHSYVSLKRIFNQTTGSSSALQVLQRLIFEACAARA